jgi:hypothetical protein
VIVRAGDLGEAVSEANSRVPVIRLSRLAADGKGIFSAKASLSSGSRNRESANERLKQYLDVDPSDVENWRQCDPFSTNVSGSSAEVTA